MIKHPTSLQAASDDENMKKTWELLKRRQTLMIYQARCLKTIQIINLVCQQQLTYPNVPHKNDEISYSKNLTKAGKQELTG